MKLKISSKNRMHASMNVHIDERILPLKFGVNESNILSANSLSVTSM